MSTDSTLSMRVLPLMHRKLHHAFTGAVVNSSAAFGQGTGPVWLDNVHCLGTESQLVNCPSRRVDFLNCYYSDVAGVTCQGKVYWKCYEFWKC